MYTFEIKNHAGRYCLVKVGEGRTQEWPLEPVVSSFIKEKRKEGVSFFVYKEDGEIYWYSEIPWDTNIRGCGTIGKHRCHSNGNCCSKFCKKALRGATHIDRYSFIKNGCETVNTLMDSLLVFECTEYSRSKEEEIDLQRTVDLRRELYNLFVASEQEDARPEYGRTYRIV